MLNSRDKAIVLIDDERSILNSLELLLESEGFQFISSFTSGREALDFIRTGKAGVILLDLNMPDISGLNILKTIIEEYPQVPVIIITGQNNLDTAVLTMKQGAFDYLVKPVISERVLISVNNALKYRELHSSYNLLKKEFFMERLKEVEIPQAFSSIITGNKSMFKIFQYLTSVSTSSQPVLLTGETGVGKELFARALHDLSGCTGDFITMDVSSYDSTMFSDTLFGHVKGAFTGAAEIRNGLIKTAQKGTLFLDEIGDLSSELQSVLLRMIQEHEYRQGGSDQILKTDARIILATNKDLNKLMDEGKFRRDLFYRLETHYIEIPPLRCRKEDIPLLVNHFVNLACRDMNKKIDNIPLDFFSLLSAYNYPGNVRELRNIIFNSVAITEGNTLHIRTIKDKLNIVEKYSDPDSIQNSVYFTGKLPSFQEIETILLEEAMIRSGRSQSKAADLLGISRQALNRRLNKKQV